MLTFEQMDQYPTLKEAINRVDRLFQNEDRYGHIISFSIRMGERIWCVDFLRLLPNQPGEAPRMGIQLFGKPETMKIFEKPWYSGNYVLTT